MSTKGNSKIWRPTIGNNDHMRPTINIHEEEKYGRLMGTNTSKNKNSKMLAR